MYGQQKGLKACQMQMLDVSWLFDTVSVHTRLYKAFIHQPDIQIFNQFNSLQHSPIPRQYCILHGIAFQSIAFSPGISQHSGAQHSQSCILRSNANILSTIAIPRYQRYPSILATSLPLYQRHPSIPATSLYTSDIPLSQHMPTKYQLYYQLYCQLYYQLYDQLYCQLYLPALPTAKIPTLRPALLPAEQPAPLPALLPVKIPVLLPALPTAKLSAVESDVVGVYMYISNERVVLVWWVGGTRRRGLAIFFCIYSLLVCQKWTW